MSNGNGVATLAPARHKQELPEVVELVRWRLALGYDCPLDRDDISRAVTDTFTDAVDWRVEAAGVALSLAGVRGIEDPVTGDYISRAVDSLFGIVTEAIWFGLTQGHVDLRLSIILPRPLAGPMQ